MKKIFLGLAMAVALYLGISEGFAPMTAYATCGAVCAMECGNRCSGTCYDCTLGQCVDAAIQCCEEAHQATGDTGPCTVENAN